MHPEAKCLRNTKFLVGPGILKYLLIKSYKQNSHKIVVMYAQYADFKFNKTSKMHVMSSKYTWYGNQKFRLPVIQCS